MLNIKLVYSFNEFKSLYWSKKDKSSSINSKKIEYNPIKEIYIDGVSYKRCQIKDEYKVDFSELCRKMDKYLKKKESIFSNGELDVVKAYNTYPYKNYQLISYEVIGKLVSIELQVS